MSSRLLFGLYALAFSRRIAVGFLLCVFCLTINLFGSQEKIDYIVAVVNDKVITLTDLKVSEAFGLFEEEIKEKRGNLRLLILENLIDQELVIPFASERISVHEEELDSFFKEVEEKTGSVKLQNMLVEFGMNQDDLKEYLRKKMLYQKVISQKFSQSETVSLKEIETYYSQIYVPSQKEKGEQPEPMMDILSEIELSIKKERIRKQIEDWLENLRKQAEIQINPIRI
ncbi:MAG: SurA N-terminal domain-containing protein [Candidatus Aminicenantes bacterium]|nr:MAG: SurA N-terminal domain-containing protein [Candidatus Aminicenantes bacterium]